MSKTETLKIRLRPTERAQIEEMARRDDVPMSAVIRRAIRALVDAEDRKKAAT